MERHVKVNAYIVNLMREHGRLDREIDRSEPQKDLPNGFNRQGGD